MNGLDLSAREVKKLQDSNETLAELQRMVEKGDPRFIQKILLLYRNGTKCSGTILPL